MTVKEIINKDLLAYAGGDASKVPVVVEDLITSLPTTFLKDWENFPTAAQAWNAIQILENTNLEYHKSEELGEFIYNTEMFTIKESNNRIYLHYNSSYKGVIELPDGCISTELMFYKCDLPKGFTLGDKFDTFNVTNMVGMFHVCTLPSGFTLGDKFDTSNVTNMQGMFFWCWFPEGFNLGNKFDTSAVTNMNSMFWGCKLPEGFTLGDKFDTSKVTDTERMFDSCELPEGFTLGDKFDTSSVTDMSYMFYECKLPEGFTLGDKFDTSSVTDMHSMFAYCNLPEGFTIGDKFDTTKVTDMSSMFLLCKFPKGFTLGAKFDTSKVTNMGWMFRDCTLPDGTYATGLNPIEIINKLKSLSASTSSTPEIPKLSDKDIMNILSSLGASYFSPEGAYVAVDNIKYTFHSKYSYDGPLTLNAVVDYIQRNQAELNADFSDVTYEECMQDLYCDFKNPKHISMMMYFILPYKDYNSLFNN